MHSSISNSNQRLPQINFWKFWVPTIGLYLLILLTAELILKNAGHRPNVVDNKSLWALQRGDVYGNENEKRIVIVGASRSQMGLVPRAIEDSYSSLRAKVLSINGNKSFEIIRNLCEDPEFKGVILWSITPDMIHPSDNPERLDYVYTKHYEEGFLRGKEIEKDLNSIISSFLQSRLTLMSPDLNLRNLIKERLSPKVSFSSLEFNRHILVRYNEVMSDEAIREHRVKRLSIDLGIMGEPTTLDSFHSILKNDFFPIYTKLKNRGGKLILIRMPTSGEYWENDEKRHPRNEFWDTISNVVKVPTIHFKDFPALSGFSCPDGSHLDATDATEFTKRLCSILEDKFDLDLFSN